LLYCTTIVSIVNALRRENEKNNHTALHYV
jgi:hypothetical protein